MHSVIVYSPHHPDRSIFTFFYLRSSIVFNLPIMRGLIPIAIVLVMSTINVIDGADPRPEVADVVAPIGTIRGSFMTSRRGKRFFAARAIRYAEPPTGELRFEPPVPVKNWTIFDATEDGPSCPQPGGIRQSEDCLRLNVYTKKIPKTKGKNGDKKSPVLVFFHPGGFYGSTAQSIVYGPQYLMDKEIVAVTVNYRLATLGFLSTGDAHAPGNLGLKDQVVALRWIQRNIGAFGGDANNVTISGYSSGAWSVSMHLVSPMSKGLFHRGIAMSGTAYNQQRLPRDQLDLAKKHATTLGCPTNDTRDMIACMKTVPVENYTNTMYSLFVWNFNPILLWSPVVEPEVEGVERFLSDQPENLLRAGKMHHVPMILGNTKDEFAGVIVDWIEQSDRGNNTLFNDLETRWEELMPIILGYESGTPRSRNISARLKQYYFNDQPVSRATADGVAQFYSDGVPYATYRLASLLAQVSTEPVYLYEFAYQGRFSHNMWNATGKPYGVTHHDDLLYLFYISVTFPYFNVTDPEYPTVERMTTMWTNFAKTGNPIPVRDKNFKNVHWEPNTLNNKRYLRIDNALEMKSGLIRPERAALWDSLFHPESSTPTKY